MDELEKLAELAETATEGPWVEYGITIQGAEREDVCIVGSMSEFSDELRRGKNDKANKAFIIEARNTIPAIAARVRRMEEENARYRRIIATAIASIQVQPKRDHRRSQLWSAVGWMFGLGSGSAAKLCQEFDADPNTML